MWTAATPRAVDVAAPNWLDSDRLLLALPVLKDVRSLSLTIPTADDHTLPVSLILTHLPALVHLQNLSLTLPVDRVRFVPATPSSALASPPLPLRQLALLPGAWTASGRLARLKVMASIFDIVDRSTLTSCSIGLAPDDLPLLERLASPSVRTSSCSMYTSTSPPITVTLLSASSALRRR
ncbi:hypothetical protein JCM10213_001765 [Rhodosporidiobolus nylandii]